MPVLAHVRDDVHQGPPCAAVRRLRQDAGERGREEGGQTKAHGHEGLPHLGILLDPQPGRKACRHLGVEKLARQRDRGRVLAVLLDPDQGDDGVPHGSEVVRAPEELRVLQDPRYERLTLLLPGVEVA